MSQHAAAAVTTVKQRSVLAKLIERNITADGIHATAIEGLVLFRASRPTMPLPALHAPALCIVAQGRKRVMLANDRYVYGADRCLVISVDLPIVGQVIEASTDAPYLCLRLDLEPGQLGALMLELDMSVEPNKGRPGLGLVLTPAAPELLDAAVRLMRLLDTPQDIRILAPLVVREMLYRLLVSEHAAPLRHIALADQRQQSVNRAISWIKENYAAPFRIEAVARHTGVSSSALHHNFKAVTAMSPLQYQKQLRLQEARRLMMGDDFDAARASYSVGYESPSQFSREYSRLFGAPPSRDIAELKRTAGAAG